IVKLLLQRGADSQSMDRKGNSSLHIACECGDEGITVRQLLKKGADFKLSDNIGRTALHDAASRGHEDVVRILISEGADCTATDENFVTPL
ncbi:ankyrin, partial [Hyaloscypha bicolor E]